MTQLNADTLKRSVQTRLLGQVVHYWDEVDSTNAALARLSKAGAGEGTVVVADAQTAGRGRIGKPWFSPPGVNLHLSVLLKPPIHLNEARLFTLIGSLAIADATEAHGVKAQVNWPNDVLVNDKKLAGVLAEVQTHQGRVEQVILGIGVNLNIDRPSMDRVFGAAAIGATSLYEALGRTIDRNAFAARLLESLEKHYFDFLAHGKGPLFKEWRSRSFLGRRVTVREEDMHVEGIAMDLDEEGCLLVTLDDGSTVRVQEGEVIPLSGGPRGGE
jgi:BirA family biotin operon repressor/biotin-[acetyl-CoA-carboxylase] ligase